MARKRKIPARKHHGIRDPLKQLEEREKKLKNVVNNPPAEKSEKLSFKFAQFKKLADDAKAGKKIKRIHNGREDKPKDKSKVKKTKKTPAGEKDGNKFRNIKQFIDEKDEDYLRRVNRVTNESVKEAQYEAKYGVNVIRDQKTGAISIRKRPKNEIDELMKHKQKETRLGKQGNRRGSKKEKPPAKPMDPKMAKALIKQAIKEDDEEKNKETTEIIEEYKHDVFKFGEIVHAPPTLSTLPRKAQRSETVSRPGKKNNLLLKALLNKETDTSITNSKPKTSASKAKITGKVTKVLMKGKRKDLPAATRMMLESEQSKIIELYRSLKKSKEKSV